MYDDSRLVTTGGDDCWWDCWWFASTAGSNFHFAACLFGDVNEEAFQILPSQRFYANEFSLAV